MKKRSGILCKVFVSATLNTRIRYKRSYNRKRILLCKTNFATSTHSFQNSIKKMDVGSFFFSQKWTAEVTVSVHISSLTTLYDIKTRCSQ